MGLSERMDDDDFLEDVVGMVVGKIDPKKNWAKFRTEVVKELKKLKLDKKFDDYDIHYVLKSMGYENFPVSKNVRLIEKLANNGVYESLRTNLEGNFGGYAKDVGYFTVIKPFDVYIMVDSVPSNAHYGRGRVLQPIYQKVKLQKGDQIQLLPGGVFVVSTRKVGIFPPYTYITVSMNKPEFSPFEKGDKRNLMFPLDSLKREENERSGIKAKYDSDKFMPKRSKNEARLAQKFSSISEKVINLKSSFSTPRDEMPQIDSTKKLREYLKKNDIDFESVAIPAKELSPTQTQLETDKADNIWADYLKKKNEKTNPLSGEIVISQDKYILDGHHRWFAAKRNDESMKLNCLMLGDNAKPALEILKNYEGSSFRDIEDKKVSERILEYMAKMSKSHNKTTKDGETPHFHNTNIDNKGDGYTTFTSKGAKNHFHKIVNHKVMPAGQDNHTHDIVKEHNHGQD